MDDDAKKTIPKKPLARQWRRLYELEAKIHALDPWKWLSPSDIFCLQFEDRPPLFICFHKNGDVKSIDIGVGWVNYVMLLHVHTHKIHYPGFYFETFMFQAGRVEPGRAFDIERESYEKYGNGAGAKTIPFFRAHRVGFTPWPLNRHEAEEVCSILFYTLGMLLRIEDAPGPIGAHAMKQVLTARISKDGVMTPPEWQPLPDIPNGIQADVNLPGDLLQTVRNLPEAPRPVEIEHIFLPVHLRDNQTPSYTALPQTGYVFLIAGGAADSIGHTLVLHADGDLANVWAQIPLRVLQTFASQHARPREIMVTDTRLMNVLRPLTELLPIKLTRAESLPIIERDGKKVLKKLTRVKKNNPG